MIIVNVRMSSTYAHSGKTRVPTDGRLETERTVALRFTGLGPGHTTSGLVETFALGWSHLLFS